MSNINNPSGGGGNDLGYFATPLALTTAYPIGTDGQFAVVGSTDTIWVWDTGTNAWVDTSTHATGNVVGPASSTDGEIPLFDSTTGKLLKNSSKTLSDIRQMSVNAQVIAGDGPYSVALNPTMLNTVQVTPTSNGVITFTGMTPGTLVVIQNNSANKTAVTITGSATVNLTPRVTGNQQVRGTFFYDTISNFRKMGQNYSVYLDAIDQNLTTTSTVSFANLSGTNTGDETATTITNKIGNPKLFHGVESRLLPAPLPTNTTTNLFGLTTATTPLTYYRNGVKTVVSTDVSVLHNPAAGIYFIYFSDDAGTLTASATPWSMLDTSIVPVATVTWNGSNYGIVNDERHAYNRDLQWHSWSHQTIGSRYKAGLDFAFAGTTIANTTFSVASGNIMDEDIDFSISTQTQCRTWYQTGATSYAFDNTLSTRPYKQNGTGIQAVNSTGYGLVTITANNRWFNYWMFANTSMLAPIHVFAETVSAANTGGYTSVANARLAVPPSLTGYGLSPEWKLIRRIVVRGDGLIDNTQPVADDYRTTSTVTGSAIPSSTAGSVSETNFGNVQAAVNTLITADAAKQDILVSGTNIKTINSISILGSGDISALSGTSVLGAWTGRSASAVNQWYNVAYGNGVFVAINQDFNNTVMTSPDGVTWTSRTAQTSLWNGITYGNGLFVVVGGGGASRIMTSPDGITWTSRTAPEMNGWISVAYGNGVYVAVAQDGTNRVMRSTDAITWTSASLAANTWNSVTYGAGLFVAVSADGTNRVATSLDGITWTPRSASSASSWQCVTFGNGLFVAVAYGTTAGMTSIDGITWSAMTMPSADGWRFVTYGNGYYVATNPDGTNRSAYSTNGTSWTALVASAANDWRGVAYGNNVFVAVSQNGTNRVQTLPLSSKLDLSTQATGTLTSTSDKVATHQVLINIGGVNYYLLASNV